MKVERETVVEAVAAIGPVLGIIFALGFVGLTFSAEGGGLTPTGGQATVGVLLVFILVMTGIGMYLAKVGKGA